MVNVSVILFWRFDARQFFKQNCMRNCDSRHAFVEQYLSMRGLFSTLEICQAVKYVSTYSHYVIGLQHLLWLRAP